MKVIWRSVGDVIHIQFAKARAAGTQKSPSAGECAWLDRPINAAEGSYMVLKEKQRLISTVTTSSGTVLQKTEPHLSAVLDAMKHSSLFHVHVVGETAGSTHLFRVTRFGP